MGVSANFNVLCDNLSISEEKKIIISQRFNTICKTLNKVYWNIDSVYGGIYMGSFGRQTSNNPLAEVEMLFEMPIELKRNLDASSCNGQAIFLNGVRDVISGVYPNGVVDEDRQMIVVRFSDKLKVYILPVFRSNYDTYLRADTSNNGTWEKIDPISEIKAINFGDQITNGNLRNLCRMARAWKNQCRVPIDAILLDTFSFNFLMQWQYRDCSFKDYDRMCLEFFRYLKNMEPNKVYWEALGSGKLVYNPENFRYKAIIAYDKVEKARSEEQNNFPWRAKQVWRHLFGYMFPESLEIEEELNQMSERIEAVHGAQLKCASILTKKKYIHVISQLHIAIAIITGLLIIGYTAQFNMGLIVFSISSMLFVVSLYVHRFNFRRVIKKHKECAMQMIYYKEECNTLLYDLHYKNISVTALKEKKDKLERNLFRMYMGTSVYISKRYLETTKALNKTSGHAQHSDSTPGNNIKAPIWRGSKFYTEASVHKAINS